MVASGNVRNSKLKVSDCWDSNSWDLAKLIELVGVEKTEILHSNVWLKHGAEKFVWEPNFSGEFTTRLTWDLVREKGVELEVSN